MLRPYPAQLKISLRPAWKTLSPPAPKNSSNQIFISSMPTPAASASPNPSFERTVFSYKKPANSFPPVDANRAALPASAPPAISPRAQKKPPSPSSTGCVLRWLQLPINFRDTPRGQPPPAPPPFECPTKQTRSAGSSAPALPGIISANTWPSETGSPHRELPTRRPHHLNFFPARATNRSLAKLAPHCKIQKNGFSSTRKLPASPVAPVRTLS